MRVAFGVLGKGCPSWWVDAVWETRLQTVVGSVELCFCRGVSRLELVVGADVDMVCGVGVVCGCRAWVKFLKAKAGEPD